MGRGEGARGNEQEGRIRCKLTDRLASPRGRLAAFAERQSFDARHGHFLVATHEYDVKCSVVDGWQTALFLRSSWYLRARERFLRVPLLYSPLTSSFVLLSTCRTCRTCKTTCKVNDTSVARHRLTPSARGCSRT
jgi:hypothetical protein